MFSITHGSSNEFEEIAKSETLLFVRVDSFVVTMKAFDVEQLDSLERKVDDFSLARNFIETASVYFLELPVKKS